LRTPPGQPLLQGEPRKAAAHQNSARDQHFAPCGRERSFLNRELTRFHLSRMATFQAKARPRIVQSTAGSTYPSLLARFLKLFSHTAGCDPSLQLSISSVLQANHLEWRCHLSYFLFPTHICQFQTDVLYVRNVGQLIPGLQLLKKIPLISSK
jgi:hypothetical protein